MDLTVIAKQSLLNSGTRGHRKDDCIHGPFASCNILRGVPVLIILGAIFLPLLAEFPKIRRSGWLGILTFKPRA
jgi:hypothetical protein